MRKIIYLINPISGTAKKTVIENLIKKTTTEKGVYFEVLHTNAMGDYDFIKDKILNEAITDVVIVGGDGTVNQVISSLHATDVNFGIIPMGSGNGLAYSAGIPWQSAKAIDVIFTGNPKRVDGFWINKEMSFMLSGLGLDAEVAHGFASQASRGLLTYTQQSLFNFFKAQPYQFEVSLDGFSFYTDAFFICVANSNQFGNNFTIAPKASLSDGLLDVVVVQKMNKAKLPFAIMRQVRGNNKLQQLVEDIRDKNILYFQTPTLSIRNLKHAPLHIDGEPRQTAEAFNIQVVENCFKLIMPAVHS